MRVSSPWNRRYGGCRFRWAWHDEGVDWDELLRQRSRRRGATPESARSPALQGLRDAECVNVQWRDDYVRCSGDCTTIKGLTSRCANGERTPGSEEADCIRYSGRAGGSRRGAWVPVLSLCQFRMCRSGLRYRRLSRTEAVRDTRLCARMWMRRQAPALGQCFLVSMRLPSMSSGGSGICARFAPRISAASRCGDNVYAAILLQ